MAEARQRGLGRGLSALLGGAADATPASPRAAANETGAPRELPIELVEPNPDQPRGLFDPDLLNELAESIAERGVLQPILVRPSPQGSGRWQIVAGERRWRAAGKAGLTTIPALVKDFSDAEVLESAIVENVQRADLNPVEEALALRMLMQRFGHTQEAVSRVVGKSRSHVANSLRLLALPQTVLVLLETGKLTSGHARAIINTPEPELLAARVLREELSVRQTENLARDALLRAAAPPRRRRVADRSQDQDADVAVLEADLSEALGVAVALRDQGGRGELRLSYSSLEQLDDLCARLMRPA